MAYDKETLRLLGGVPGQQFFMYRTADDIAAVSADSYFNDAVGQYNLSNGDVIQAVTGFGTANVTDTLVVTVDGTVATTTIQA